MKRLYVLYITRMIFLISFILISATVFSQGAHPGTDPDGGLTTPVDGGILMALLGGAGLVTMYFKKKKRKDNH